MSKREGVSTEVQNAWSKLNARWQGEDANAFHREYIVKISEVTDSFDSACLELESISSELQKELQAIEQRTANL